MVCLVSTLMACQSNTEQSTSEKSTNQQASSIKIATFNVSMEATNYIPRNELVGGGDVLKQRLANGEHSQIRNIAEILQRVRPDIVLLNEFDYIPEPAQGVEAFIKHYLNVGQNGQAAIDYPYYYLAPSNTGLATEFDLDNNGKAEGYKADAQGFGFFEGHYAMVVLSKYPIAQDKVRTFQKFLWKDMPGALKPFYPKTGEAWYNEQEWNALRLSSKSHWDVPVNVDGKLIHVLASHPTPPVFDGDDDHNGKRNHDEIRLWTDYITQGKGDYIYDDNRRTGGLGDNASFVVMGDLNATIHGGNARIEGIGSLLNSPRVNNSFVPSSEGGKENRPDDAHSAGHTAYWGGRVDYVLPSADLKVKDSGVFWPTKDDKLFRLVADRAASSDHRLVWIEIEL